MRCDNSSLSWYHYETSRQSTKGGHSKLLSAVDLTRVLEPSLCLGLPLHVRGHVGPAAFERDDVVDYVALSTMRIPGRLLERCALLRVTFDSAVLVPSARGAAARLVLGLLRRSL